MSVAKFNKIVAKPSLKFIKVSMDKVPAVNPDKVFTGVYKPLDKGNSKLNENILSFSLPPVMTCGRHCAGCYDVRSMRYPSVKAKRLLNLSMALHNMDDLEARIIKQIKNSRTVEYIRIHVGGDFFSDEYVNMWERIAFEVTLSKPNVKIYTYTKTKHTERLEGMGINVVASILPNKKMNFGSLDYVKSMAKEFNGVVCPATVKDVEPQFCGNKCKACMSNKFVMFKQH